MSRYDDIDDAFDGLETNLDKLANIVLKALNEETSKAMDKAYFEFGEYQRRKITEIFENAVDSFYSSLGTGFPKFYNRTYGLYNVLDIKTDKSNMVITSDENGYMDLFDPESMHSDRSGGDLFKKVFIEGWHGGAESGPGHPPGRTPYWRTPYPRYSKWGKPAEKTKSAYKMTVDELKSIEGTEMFDVFKSISQKYNDEAVERVKQNIPKYEEEVYG